MYLFKKLIYFIYLIFYFTIFWMYKKFDTDGLTLKLKVELNKPSEYFPIKSNFVFANIDIKQPNIFHQIQID